MSAKNLKQQADTIFHSFKMLIMHTMSENKRLQTNTASLIDKNQDLSYALHESLEYISELEDKLLIYQIIDEMPIGDILNQNKFQ